MRKPGQKTYMEDRRKWSNKKIITEQKKFTRRDPGGKDYREVLDKKLCDIALCYDDDIMVFNRSDIIESHWNEMGSTASGIMIRQKDNFTVLEERLCE